MNRAYIFLGSNIDKKKNFLQALQRLARLGRIVSISSVYETAPIGDPSTENFYNGAVLLETELTAPALKRALRDIEAELGRVRSADRNAPRTIDLDVVLFNQDQLHDEDLEIPDPLILKRAFMASALAEINADYVHPVTGQSLLEIARRFGKQPAGMTLDAAMTARARQTVNEIFSGAH